MRIIPQAILLLILLSSGYVYSDCIINASVDKNSVVVGDPVALNVVVRYQSQENCIIRDDINFGKFKLLNRDVKSESRDDQKIDTYTFILTPLELGEVSIPPIAVYTSVDAGYSEEESPLSTQEIKISVSGVIKEEQPQLKDILPPEKVYEHTYLLIYIIVGLLVFSAVIYLITRYLKKRRVSATKGIGEEISTPPISPYEEALIALKDLEEQRLITRSEYKQLYLRLTEILKRFVERFYGFGATEMTTYELTVYLLDHPQPNLNLDDVRGILSQADLVKFARFSPEPEMAYRDFNGVRDIIEKAARPSPVDRDETSRGYK